MGGDGREGAAQERGGAHTHTPQIGDNRPGGHGTTHETPPDLTNGGGRERLLNKSFLGFRDYAGNNKLPLHGECRSKLLLFVPPVRIDMYGRARCGSWP